MSMDKKHIVWIMGPTSSGKTTIAKQFQCHLRKKNVPVIHFDGDEVRDIFGDAHGFSDKDRLKVVETLVYLSNKLLSAGLNVIISALTANDDARDYVKKNVKNLVLVHLKCEIATCVARDPKGLYGEAQAGKISTLVGYNSEYRDPYKPDIVIDTEFNCLGECVEQLSRSLADLGFGMLNFD